MCNSKVSRISENLYNALEALRKAEGWTFLIASHEVAKNPRILIPHLTAKTKEQIS